MRQSSDHTNGLASLWKRECFIQQSKSLTSPLSEVSVCLCGGSVCLSVCLWAADAVEAGRTSADISTLRTEVTPSALIYTGSSEVQSPEPRSEAHGTYCVMRTRISPVALLSVKCEHYHYFQEEQP